MVKVTWPHDSIMAQPRISHLAIGRTYTKNGDVYSQIIYDWHYLFHYCTLLVYARSDQLTAMTLLVQQLIDRIEALPKAQHDVMVKTFLAQLKTTSGAKQKPVVADLKIVDEKSDKKTTPRNAIRNLIAQGHECYISSQILSEFWVVATRPIDENGLECWTYGNRNQKPHSKLPDCIEIFRSNFKLVRTYRYPPSAWQTCSWHQTSGTHVGHRYQ